jgi:hypothetical protein
MFAVLQSRDILVRIRIRGSALTDPDPPIFVRDTQDGNKILFKKFFCLLLFEGTSTSFFKDKRS